MKAFKFSFTRAQIQKGLTLIELLIVLAIAGGLIVLVLFGIGIRNNQKGVSEGQRVAAVTSCGIKQGTTVTSLGSVTLPALINYGCFGEMTGVTGLGTPAATAINPLTGTAYTITAVNLVGTNDGLAMTTATQNKHCTGVVTGAQQSGAARISVTPSGGAAVVVKPLNGELDIAAVGLNTACNGTEPIAVQVVIAK